MNGIRLAKSAYLTSNTEGYTIFDNSLGIPIILTDAPYSRLKSEVGYAKGFVEILETAKGKYPKEVKNIDKVLKDIESLNIKPT